jgi:hypothetical protein
MAETIYLAVTGNDATGTGSINSPFATFATTLSAVSAHDTTIIIKDGTYTFNGDTDGVQDRSAVQTIGDYTTGNGVENPDYPFPRLIHIIHTNLKIEAENHGKVTIDCVNTQPGIWFLTQWVDSFLTSQPYGNSFDVLEGYTKANAVSAIGLTFTNYKKMHVLVNWSNTTPTANGSSSGIFNFSDGFFSRQTILLHKCVIKDSIIQNNQYTQIGIVSSRRQTSKTVRADELAAQPDVATNVSPAGTNSSGGWGVTYSQCLLNNIGSDVNSNGTYSFATARYSGNATYLPKSLSANFINCTFYSTRTGGSQYNALFQQSASGSSWNIQNCIFYNVGDPITLSDKNTPPWTINQMTSGVNIYKNNSLYGITQTGSFPYSLQFPSTSGNLLDTDPQILAPNIDRWGLRQNSPCKGAGANNPIIL